MGIFIEVVVNVLLMPKNITRIGKRERTVNKMSKLFIIGNGFDCYGHDMPTKYSDFKQFLLEKYPNIMSIPPRIPTIPTIYPATDRLRIYAEVGRVRYILHVLDACQNDQWSNLEAVLGDKIFEAFVDDILDEEYNTESTISFENNDAIANGIAEMTDFLSVGIVMEDTFDSLKEYFYQWVTEKLGRLRYDEYEKKKEFTQVLSCDNEAEPNIFMNFNYTLTLEKLYGISGKNVYHIHGKVGDSKKKVFFGHGKGEWEISMEDVPTLASSFYQISRNLRKNTWLAIKQNKELFERIRNVSEIYPYGFSFSDVDMVYIDKISEKVDPTQVTWYFNTYDTDNNPHFIELIKKRGYKIRQGYSWDRT